MYIPKTVIAALAIIGAIVLGWVSHDLLERLVSAVPAAAASVPVAAVSPAGLETPPAPSGPSPVNGTAPGTLPGSTNVYLTIVTPSGATTGPTGAPMKAVVSEATPGAQGVAVRVPAPSQPGAPGRPAARPGPTIAPDRAPSGPTSRAPRDGRTIAHAPRTIGAVNGPGIHVTPGLATAIGEHIVIAQDGSIVYVGDNGYVIANTGDAVQGGVVALDSQGSTFSTQSDQRAVIVAGGGSQTRTGSSAGTSATGRGSAPLTTSRVATTQGVLAGGSPAQVPTDMSPLASAFGMYTLNRTADIAGFEDHSVLVRGLGNVVTYDDSNVFMNRDGKINANTGDTDSSGLNAVAVLRSTVSAGPHCDDGCDDESIIQARAGVFDEGDVAIDGNGNVVWAPDAADESSDDDDSERRQPARGQRRRRRLGRRREP